MWNLYNDDRTINYDYKTKHKYIVSGKTHLRLEQTVHNH